MPNKPRGKKSKPIQTPKLLDVPASKPVPRATPKPNNRARKQPSSQARDFVSGVFTSGEVTKITGFSKRQLDVWATDGSPVAPSKPATGSGNWRLYSFEDLVHLRIVQKLDGLGVSMQRIKQIFDYIKKQLRRSELIAHIVITGKQESEIFAVDGDQLIELLNSPGQTAMNLLTIRDIEREVQEEVKVIKPEAEIDNTQLSLLGEAEPG